MRYKVQTYDRFGQSALSHWVDAGTELWHHDTAEILARTGVTTFLLKFQDNSATEYGPMQYKCEWCGDYGHAIESCPTIQNSHRSE